MRDADSRSTGRTTESDDRTILAPPARGRGDADGFSVGTLVRQIPNFLKLLGRLVRDPRVSVVDKGILAASIAYIVSPFDLITDFIPVIGQLDDIYLLALSLNRLVNNAGMEVLLDHWDGDEESLEEVMGALDRAGEMLPAPIRQLLRRRTQ